MSRTAGPSKREKDKNMSFLDNSRQAKFFRHEEKLEHLQRFIGYFLDRTSISDNCDAEARSLTVIARSPASPVAVAVQGAARELKALGIEARVIFARFDPAEQFAAWAELVGELGGDFTIDSLRWARRPALLDAHEQLVLGTAMCWSGDSMRREPDKRDAYEVYDTFEPVAAARARNAFQALWQLSEPVPASRLVRTELASSEPEHWQADAPQTGLKLAVTPAASTRH